ncbi:hypothetical protein M3193_13705 [Sporosarcina luteola]|uniref:hypothetical protein n=1 Tax=Sporosarcina luteola TaxID=582850 RepID=UPI0020410C23|nr:hypothetical protein [Sporosarcina luteola]MCM3745190.1 hypothetical protein [Sporosarcina luteola]
MYYSSFPYGFNSRQQAFMPVHPGYMAMPTPAPQDGRSPFPPVNTRKLNESAKRFKQVMNEANLFIGTLTASDDFARRLMDAAQRSDQKEVERLVRSTGVTIKYTLSYTPSGIRIDFSNSDAQNSCCTLRMALGW